MVLQLPLFYAITPEIFVLCMSCMVLMADVFLNHRWISISYYLTQLTLIIAFVVTGYQLTYPMAGGIVTFQGNYILDHLAIISKLAIDVLAFLIFLYGRAYNAERHIPAGEYHVLGLFAVLGMMVMVSAYSFLTIFLGLELLSLPLYAMVAMWRESGIASEAAMKYFVTSALATGILLYGISMLYGLTQSIDISGMAQLITAHSGPKNILLLLSLVFIVTGIAFKLGAAPFHMWVPDVYHGAPTSVTLFIVSAPKIAAFVVLVRILMNALPTLYVEWQQLLIVMTILSMFLGNVVAIAQSNIKRMLAYSSIAHIGYTLLGLLSSPETTHGAIAALFYVISYAAMALGAFALIALLSRLGIEAENIDDFRGLNARHPWFAFIMLLFMFSMAGVPPTLGFFAKLGVLEVLVKAHLLWLAVLAVLFSIIGLYYYLRIVKYMYFDEPSAAITKIPVVASSSVSIAISVNGIAMLVLGLLPGSLFMLCRFAFI